VERNNYDVVVDLTEDKWRTVMQTEGQKEAFYEY
jgi:hypothetical protein